VAAGHVTADVIEASFHVFRGNAERSQSCRQRAAKVVSSWPIFKPGCRAFAVFYFKLLCMVFALQIERFAEPSHSNREGVTIDRLVVSSRRYQEKPSGSDVAVSLLQLLARLSAMSISSFTIVRAIKESGTT
jgi:hypothetical protein